jgi:hypothetical protein
MYDLAFAGLTLAFFFATVGLLKLCERLMGGVS